MPVSYCTCESANIIVPPSVSVGESESLKADGGAGSWYCQSTARSSTEDADVGGGGRVCISSSRLIVSSSSTITLLKASSTWSTASTPKFTEVLASVWSRNRANRGKQRNYFFNRMETILKNSLTWYRCRLSCTDLSCSCFFGIKYFWFHWIINLYIKNKIWKIFWRDDTIKK